MITAENPDSVKMVVNEKDSIELKNFRVKDEKIYLDAEEAFSGLGLKFNLSSDKNWMFFQNDNLLVTVDLKDYRAVEGTKEFAFSGAFLDGDKLYLAEDFFILVLAQIKGVKIRIDKLSAVHSSNDSELKLPDKFKKDPVDIVVIDPGHGGDNFGATTADGWREKDLTLKIAKRTKDYLKSIPGMKVYLTREDDSYLDLDSRTAFANKLSADLFLSIHINAAEALSASGFETFFLSLKASDDASRKLAMWENLEMSGAQSNQSGELKPEFSELELILGDLAQTEHLAESDFLARLVQKNLEQAMQQTTNRGIRQAPFRVLMTANMPAVLVEVGFLTNEADRRNITTPATQDKIASALARSILQFRDLKAKKLGMVIKK